MLAEQAFDAAEFPFAFLQAFANKETTIKRLRKGKSNKSDLGLIPPGRPTSSSKCLFSTRAFNWISRGPIQKLFDLR